MRRVASAAVASAASAAVGVRTDGCPVRSTKAPASAGGCPMHSSAPGADGDGHGRPLDPRNQMPAVPNQSPAAGQAAALSTDRVASTIPKATGDGKTWEYPSPQMFWNALVRKGRAEGASEADMDTVVAVHNNMNELSWKAVLDWEAMHGTAAPKLARFVGRPQEMSPKAQLKALFGHPKPFDRHDWVVDRDGIDVRYIIDYYSDESKSHLDEKPKLEDVESVKSILVDVRPALDSVDAFLDRAFRMPLRRWQGAAPSEVPFFASADMAAAKRAEEAQKAQVDEAEAQGGLSQNAMAAVQAAIGARCAEFFQALRNCGDDEKRCASASIALQHCVASVVAPNEAAAFADAVANDPKNAEAAYVKMDAALEKFAKAPPKPALSSSD